MSEQIPEYSVIESYYLRGKECLLLHANLEPLFVDYYLHFGALKVSLKPQEDTFLKDFLAATILHASSKPRAQRHAWTAHFPQWPRNFFVSASSPEEEIMGNLFQDNVASGEIATLSTQQQEGTLTSQTSVIELEESHLNALLYAQEYYNRSEQRPGVFVHGKGDDYFLLAAMPGSDPDWVTKQTREDILALFAKIDHPPLERRKFFFRCSCSLERIFPAIRPLIGNDVDEFFGKNETITISCPRCSKKFSLSRDQAASLL